MKSLMLRPGSRGRLDTRGPLHAHLAVVVLRGAGIKVMHPNFEATCLSAKQGVYLCRERKSRTLLVCKFFGTRRRLSERERRDVLNHEFKSLSTVRKMGFYRFPHRVVRPLSKNEHIACLLVEDFARGHDLDYYITKAVYEGQHQRLYRKLTKLAHFLAVLHRRTAGAARVHFTDTADYFKHLVDSLARDGLLDSGESEELGRLCDEWDQNADMRADVLVLVHGDATPTNFIFHHKDGVTAIDLERMHHADRVYDVGMLAAELKHHFAWRALQADAAEPFIAHFLRTYCQAFPDPESGFNAVTQRNRFYMALGELRIARNAWLPWKHRKWLIDEARRCLR